MMVPSISIIEVPAPDGGVIYQAFAVVDGVMLHHEEHAPPDWPVPPAILAHQLRKAVAHTLLEKMMNDAITES